MSVPRCYPLLLSRFTDLVGLPAGWAWLANGWVQIILGVLLIIEVIADKVPAVDSINDWIQTIMRPAAEAWSSDRAPWRRRRR